MIKYSIIVSCILLLMTINNTLAVFQQSDEALEELSEDLFHFLSLSVQLNVYQKMKTGPVDLQSLADWISDLGVSFRQLDEGKVTNLADQLNSIGAAIDLECSTRCDLPSEITDGLALIDTMKAKETEVYFRGGTVYKLENSIKNIENAIAKTIPKALETLTNDVPKFKAVNTSIKLELDKTLTAIDNIGKAMTDLAVNITFNDGLEAATKLTNAGLPAEIEVVRSLGKIPAISTRFKTENATMVDFQQKSTAFSGEFDKLKTISKQNNLEQVLATLKTLEKLNVGSKFLNYFNNAFTESYWLKKLLTGNDNQKLGVLKRKLRHVKNIGERLDPLRNSVANINVWKVHQALSDYTTFLDESVSLLPELSRASFHISECIKDVNLIHILDIDIQPAIDNLKDPEQHTKEFKESLQKFITERASHLELFDKFHSMDSSRERVEYLQSDDNVKEFTNAMKAFSDNLPSVKLDIVRSWLNSLGLWPIYDKISRWISDTQFLRSLECLNETQSIELFNSSRAVLQTIRKLGKSAEHFDAVLKAANELKTPLGLWHQLAAAPTRHRRASSENTQIEEVIASTLAVRRVIRACTNGTLTTLLRSVPELDSTVKSTFKNIIDGCEELQKRTFSVLRVTELSGLFKVLEPLANSSIESVKLADQLAQSTTDSTVLNALQNLETLDLNFASYNGALLDQELLILEKMFDREFGIRQRKPHKQEVVEEEFNWELVIISLCVLALLAVFACSIYFWCRKPGQPGNFDEADQDEVEMVDRRRKNRREMGKKAENMAKNDAKKPRKPPSNR